MKRYLHAPGGRKTFQSPETGGLGPGNQTKLSPNPLVLSISSQKHCLKGIKAPCSSLFRSSFSCQGYHAHIKHEYNVYALLLLICLCPLNFQTQPGTLQSERKLFFYATKSGATILRMPSQEGPQQCLSQTLT